MNRATNRKRGVLSTKKAGEARGERVEAHARDERRERRKNWKMSTSYFDKDDLISLKRLCKHCVDACIRGCKEIRTVAKRNRMNENTNEKIEHTFKDENDARSALTEADVNAQSVIIGALTNSYGSHLNSRRGRWRREREAEERRTEVERVLFRV